MKLATRASIAALAILLAAGSCAYAQDATPLPEPAANPEPANAARVLTPEEKAEKEARKACKIKICDIIVTKNPLGDDVACDIVKTWREADITKMLGGQINWPWGKAVCQSKLELKREPLANAVAGGEHEVVLPTQKVSCKLNQKSEGEPYVVEVAMAPKVKFKDGKAIEAMLNWGEAMAPLFVYPLVYGGTALDNSSNVLGPEVVRMVNEFSTKKCAEVKNELPSSANR
jgi:hypothetical protein